MHINLTERAELDQRIAAVRTAERKLGELMVGIIVRQSVEFEDVYNEAPEVLLAETVELMRHHLGSTWDRTYGRCCRGLKRANRRYQREAEQ